MDKHKGGSNLFRKAFFPITIVIASFALAWITCSRYLTIELNLSQAFESGIQPPPGMAIQLNGVAGDKAIVGFSWRMDDPGRIGFGENSSEKLRLTPKKLNEIRRNLSNLDPQKWEVLTKLPSPIFRFEIYLISDETSPNNAKKASHMLLNLPGDVVHKLKPGQKVLFGKDLSVEDISRTLATSNIELVYQSGMYMNFFNKKGEFISQATGALIVRPTLFTQASVFASIWVMLLGLIALVKKTLLSSKDFEDIKNHYRRYFVSRASKGDITA